MASLKQGEGRKGFLTRWFESIAEARMRQARHELHLHPFGDAWPKEQDDQQKERERAETKH